jgi:hypothetical protein
MESMAAASGTFMARFMLKQGLFALRFVLFLLRPPLRLEGWLLSLEV